MVKQSCQKWEQNSAASDYDHQKASRGLEAAMNTNDEFTPLKDTAGAAAANLNNSFDRPVVPNQSHPNRPPPLIDQSSSRFCYD